MKLNVRLNLIANWIKEQDFQHIWDVGTDHGLLPVFLNQKLSIKEIWASDKSVHFIKKQKNITMLNKINFFVSDGLEKRTKYMDVVILAGLGTRKILKILQKDQKNIQNYIVQTKSNPWLIRDWCNKFNFSLIKENILKEKENFYHTILISKNLKKNQYQKDEIYFGPILLKEKGTIFQEYWRNIWKKQKNIMNKITNINSRKKLKKENDWIESFLQDEKHAD